MIVEVVVVPGLFSSSSSSLHSIVHFNDSIVLISTIGSWKVTSSFHIGSVVVLHTSISISIISSSIGISISITFSH